MSVADGPTVFVLDDDRHRRESLGATLAQRCFHVRTFAAPAAFHRFYRADMAGCLIADVGAGPQSGVSLYQQLLSEGKRLPVIFTCAEPKVSVAVAAMRLGAIDFLPTPCDQDVLVGRLRTALELDAWWRRQEAKYADLAKRVGRLTARQRETLEYIRRGDTNKAIAARLGLTERAVEMRRASIMRKLQVRSVAELIDLTATHRVMEDMCSPRQRPWNGQ